ncbi:MAG TPA: OsmC family protein [Casimicrobiaceae bacterium]|nr:OsmC family protein [Casimicrobiaceae bacterium]
MATARATARNAAASLQVQLSDTRGHGWAADEPPDKGGTDTGPMPEELLAGSLAACTALTLRLYARRKQWRLDDVTVDVRFDAATPTPEGAVEISREIALHGELDDAQRARLIEIAQRCPIHRVLTASVRIATREAPGE